MGSRFKFALCLAIWLVAGGCKGPAPRPAYAEVAQSLHAGPQEPSSELKPDNTMATALDPPPTPPELLGPQPVEIYIHRALLENRDVQAAWHEVQALRHRIPQATALDDPMFMSTLFPVPAIAPQYSIMGYMPFMYTLAQQFPWFGTLKLRGLVADQEAKMALARLATAQLEAVAEVKRAYFDLYVSQRAIAILDENRKSAAEIADLASARSRGGGSQQDVYRAEVAVAEIDRELVTARQNFAEARASLAQLLHMSPEADLTPLSRVPTASVPEQVDRLYRMAVANRPALQERLAAIARDEREVELARKRYYPNITLGLEQWKMSEHGAVSRTASGVDNIGLVLGFNVPIYHKKLDAGVHEAQARTVADARRYDADRDRTYRDVKELLVQARAQRELIDLLQNTILPKSEKALELAAAAYPGGEVDFVTLNTGRLELLNIQLQIARLEAEQGKSLAALERVVGVELTEQPPQPIPDAAEASAPGAQPSAPAPPTVAAPPVAGSSSPFQHQSTPRGEPNG